MVDLMFFAIVFTPSRATKSALLVDCLRLCPLKPRQWCFRADRGSLIFSEELLLYRCESVCLRQMCQGSGALGGERYAVLNDDGWMDEGDASTSEKLQLCNMLLVLELYEGCLLP